MSEKKRGFEIAKGWEDKDIHIPVTIGGVTFKNPFFVASGPTTKSVKQLKRIEETGWAAASIKLSIDPARVAVAGDSAGGALAAAVCQMARDRGSSLPCAQLLIYPVTDRRMDYPSCRAYTDTPMWNARLSKKMWQGYVQDPAAPHMAYASPMEADTFEGLPPAYVETAEFDCLHDEGVAYALALQGAGVDVTLSETEGTMHGFDIAMKAPTTQAAIAARLAYLDKVFYEG